MMKALFSGNMVVGMRLVGVYDDADCEKISQYLNTQSGRTDIMDGSQLELTQFLALKPPMAASIYGEIPPDQAVILASGSLTRGLTAVGPYPDRSVALSNAVMLTFGTKSSNFFSVEIDPGYVELRAKLREVLGH